MAWEKRNCFFDLRLRSFLLPSFKTPFSVHLLQEKHSALVICLSHEQEKQGEKKSKQAFSLFELLFIGRHRVSLCRPVARVPSLCESTHTHMQCELTHDLAAMYISQGRL